VGRYKKKKVVYLEVLSAGNFGGIMLHFILVIPFSDQSSIHDNHLIPCDIKERLN